MIRKVYFSLIALFLLSFSMHKYYVSITEADYNQEKHTFEISIKFIGHDLEHALENAGVPNLYLGMEKEVKDADDYLLSYINKHFEINTGNQKVTLNFVGKEIKNDDFIYCYLETDKVKLLNNVSIKNTLLTEIFKAQSNIVYLNVGDEKNSFTLNSANTTGVHQLK